MNRILTKRPPSCGPPLALTTRRPAGDGEIRTEFSSVLQRSTLMNTARWQGEAPGRLDVLGGVADYSGALVLQMPIRATTRVTVTPLATPRLELASEQAGAFTLPLPPLTILEPAGEVV